jgi:hypothetical protein
VRERRERLLILREVGAEVSSAPILGDFELICPLVALHSPDIAVAR